MPDGAKRPHRPRPHPLESLPPPFSLISNSHSSSDPASLSGPAEGKQSRYFPLDLLPLSPLPPLFPCFSCLPSPLSLLLLSSLLLSSLPFLLFSVIYFFSLSPLPLSFLASLVSPSLSLPLLLFSVICSPSPPVSPSLLFSVNCPSLCLPFPPSSLASFSVILPFFSRISPSLCPPFPSLLLPSLLISTICPSSPRISPFPVSSLLPVSPLLPSLLFSVICPSSPCVSPSPSLPLPSLLSSVNCSPLPRLPFSCLPFPSLLLPSLLFSVICPSSARLFPSPCPPFSSLLLLSLPFSSPSSALRLTLFPLPLSSLAFPSLLRHLPFLSSCLPFSLSLLLPFLLSPSSASSPRVSPSPPSLPSPPPPDPVPVIAQTN
ncbi:hypothetical protein C7M84_023672 [Penaeus vannamei]|uniref:Uncharacterized protein n=1 Tax=Penaeus vannamei TaxID=6689 RepID=A0A3R7QLV8_PENVA|nr:hypothetical protein C7M84_023672 [Penaeus vannamei]